MCVRCSVRGVALCCPCFLTQFGRGGSEPSHLSSIVAQARTAVCLPPAPAVVLAAFTLPKVYELKKEEIDRAVDTARKQVRRGLPLRCASRCSAQGLALASVPRPS